MSCLPSISYQIKRSLDLQHDELATYGGIYPSTLYILKVIFNLGLCTSNIPGMVILCHSIPFNAKSMLTNPELWNHLHIIAQE